MNEIIRVGGKYIRMVAPFMAVGDIRYYLNGIYVAPFDAGGVVVAATNGHTLGLAWDKQGIANAPTILSVSPELLSALSPKKKTHATKNTSSDRSLVLRDDKLLRAVSNILDGVDAYIQAGTSTVDGKFPEFWKLFKNAEAWKPGLIGGFNPNYINSFAKVASVNGAKYPGVKFYHCATEGGAENSCALARVDGCDEFVGLCMPLRLDTCELPQWLPRVELAIAA